MTNHETADALTVTEFAIAMLATRGRATWKTAKHVGIPSNAVKDYVHKAPRKPNAEGPKARNGACLPGHSDS